MLSCYNIFELLTETKIDENFPNSQFKIDHFSSIDRTE